MSLERQLAHEFSRNSRHRGEEYYAHGLVQIVATTETSVIAYVVGGTRYQVRLERQDDLIAVRCTCPHFEGGSLCKHIWGTILAADSRGLLAGAAGHEHVALDWNAINDVLDALDVYDEGDVGSEGALFDDDEGARWSYQSPRPPRVSTRRGPPPPPPVPRWRQILDRMSTAPVVPETAVQSGSAEWPDETLYYVIDPAASRHTGRLVVDLLWRRWKADGTRSEPKSRRLSTGALGSAPDADRRVLTALVGATAGYAAPGYGYVPPYFAALELAGRYYVPGFSLEDLLPAICATGRALVRHGASMDEAASIAWDDGPPWRCRLDVERDSDCDGYLVSGAVHRDGHDLPLESFEVLLSAGYALSKHAALRLDHGNAFAWIQQLRSESPLRVPGAALDDLLSAMFASGRPDVRLPEGVQVERSTVPPRPCLRVRTPQAHDYPQNALHATLTFEYGSLVVSAGDRRDAVFLAAERRIVDRDLAAERGALDHLVVLGAKVVPPGPSGAIATHIPVKRWPAVLDATLHADWRLEADGASVRLAGETWLEVTSGIDWFELDGVVDFGGTRAALPELLAALQRGETTVRLADGSLGVLSDSWRAQHEALGALASRHGSRLRFSHGQAAWLDVLLATRPGVRVDEAFARARTELRGFERIEPLDPPAPFRGVLREYQRDGLGWLRFLERLGFGGCLADDMGLGKTVQVLAAITSRSVLHDRRPSLVVVPRSLVFNWKAEAARFVPSLRVLDYTGTARRSAGIDPESVDLVLTTYGTLRQDAAHLSTLEFDYVILDEAHAIKNPASASAKAARLLKGRHRLALTGTPVQNHLRDLWSLFEFLNPGMLGPSSRFAKKGAFSGNGDARLRQALAQAVRPFVLRRTKEAVARDLPTRSEQTIYCDLEPDERRKYDQLKDHYRRLLLRQASERSLARVKFQVLEALLRLRQAACHPGLIDPASRDGESTKLEVLLSHLAEVVDEGHKALVFSQFTSFLSIVRTKLDEAGIPYEYLDGQTIDREQRVARFQEDAACPLFLISLKAGGLGLNLTAADYVFLLDPWWNPAIEAQAIDRSHRIGQQRPVFACRLIARDTVEERVIELQQTKRDLANAIIDADANLLQTLTREDLERLLS